MTITNINFVCLASISPPHAGPSSASAPVSSSTAAASSSAAASSAHGLGGPSAGTGVRRDSVGSSQGVRVPGIASAVVRRAVIEARKVVLPRRDDHVRKLNNMMRCLSVLLDDELVKIALLKSSSTRLVLDQNVHIKQLRDEKMKDHVLSKFSVLAENYVAPPGFEKTTKQVKEESMSPAAVAARAQLRDLSRQDNTSIEKARGNTETTVDNFLMLTYNRMQPRIWKRPMDDYVLLISALTDLHLNRMQVFQDAVAQQQYDAEHPSTEPEDDYPSDDEDQGGHGGYAPYVQTAEHAPRGHSPLGPPDGYIPTGGRSPRTQSQGHSASGTRRGR